MRRGAIEPNRPRTLFSGWGRCQHWKRLSQSSPSSSKCHDWPTPHLAFHWDVVYKAEEVVVVAHGGAGIRKACSHSHASGQRQSPSGPSPGRAAFRGKARPALVPDCKRCPQTKHLTGLIALEHPIKCKNWPQMPASGGTFCTIGPGRLQKVPQDETSRGSYCSPWSGSPL